MIDYFFGAAFFAAFFGAAFVGAAAFVATFSALAGLATFAAAFFGAAFFGASFLAAAFFGASFLGAAFFTAACLRVLGRLLPELPITRLPFFVFLSPFPIFDLLGFGQMYRCHLPCCINELLICEPGSVHGDLWVERCARVRNRCDTPHPHMRTHVPFSGSIPASRSNLASTWSAC